MTTTPAGIPATPLPDPTPARLVATSPEDVLAAVNVVLGFVPEDSAVMLTCGGAENLHGRVDLPVTDDEEELDYTVAQLHDPALDHGVESVVFVLYTGDHSAARRVGRRLVRAFERTGIRVVETLRVHDGRWFAPGRPGVPDTGVPFDVSHHPFVVRAVLDGKVVHRSRDELAATLRGPALAVKRVARARRRAIALAAPEMAETVLRALSRHRFEDDELAAVLLGLRGLDARDAAWADFDRTTAPDHVLLWTDAVQRAPADLVAGPAAVLALAAWLAGQGALAWCAVDRCQEAEPTNSLARLVSDLLTRAVPPSHWDRVWGGEGAYPHLRSRG